MLHENLTGEFLPGEFFDVTMTASNILIGVVPAVRAQFSVGSPMVGALIDAVVRCHTCRRGRCGIQ